MSSLREILNSSSFLRFAEWRRAAEPAGGERFDRRPSLHLPRFSAAAPSERASAGAEGSEAPAAAPSPPRSGTRSGTRMRWRRNGGGDPEVARVDATRFTEADLD